MTSTIRVRVTRPFRVRGAAFEAGTVATLSALEAHAVLGGRGELLDPADGPVIKAAVEAANRSAMLLADRQRTYEPAGPWQRR